MKLFLENFKVKEEVKPPLKKINRKQRVL